MAKAVINVGYNDYVVDAEDALTLYNILAKAERYKRDYRSRDDGGPLHHIWAQDNEEEMRNFTIMSDNLYRMAKLAGKPQEK